MNLIPALISNYVHYKVWDEITYLFPNYNGPTVEVWEWISDFIPPFTGHHSRYHSWSCVSINSVTSPKDQWVNTLRPRQNGRHFPDIFKCIFLNENLWISIKISLKFVHKGPINNTPALLQTMAWRRTGDKPLSEAMVVCSTDAYMRYSASMS